MARETHTPSIVDRLTADHATGRVSYDELRENLRRDLERLFNTRQGRDDISGGYAELSKSVAVYGLRDFDSTNLEADGERRRLLRAIERTIRFFEPRFERVEIEEEGKLSPFELRFRIRAVLRNHEGDPIEFGTTVRKYGGAVVRQD